MWRLRDPLLCLEFSVVDRDVSTGDYVYLNTTAVEKNWAVGLPFVIANLSRIPDPAPATTAIL